MSRNGSNDAVPSWSGYNYQGKMTILCTLMEINKLLKCGSSLNDNFVEIERTEDFVFYKDGVAGDLYQVKAKLGCRHQSSYNDAVKKLREHRTEIQSDGGCVLISAVRVTPWNHTDVQLFKYGTSHVSLDNVGACIKKEIETYFTHTRKNEIHIENCYLQLCSMIDDFVFGIHEDLENANYKMPFFNFVNAIDEAISRVDEYAEFFAEEKHKEKVYDFMVSTINEAMKYNCNTCEKSSNLESCTESCGAKVHLENVFHMNLWRYVKIINPNKNKTNVISYASGMDSDEYAEFVIDVYRLFSDDKVKLGKDNNYITLEIDNVERAVVPTMMKVFSKGDKLRVNLQESLKRISKNTEIYKEIEGRILTAFTNGYELNLLEDKITYFPSLNLEEEGFFSNFREDTRIVDVDKFKEELGG